MTSNTQDLNEVLFNTWNRLLKSDFKGDRGVFEEKLKMLRMELLKKHPSLDRLNKNTEALLRNDFLKQQMEKCYKKHQKNLDNIKKELRAIVTKKHKFKKGLRTEYYKTNTVSLGGTDKVNFNIKNATSERYLDTFLGHYSNEIFLINFDTSLLTNIVKDIYAEVTSTAFLDNYIDELYEQLLIELKRETYSVEIISGLVEKIQAELVKKGFIKSDLPLKSASDSQIPSLDFQLKQLEKMIHGLTGKWTTLVSVGGLEFKDTTEIKIGRVKLYEQNTYDYRNLMDKVKGDNMRQVIIDFFSDKIIAEAEVDAYGKHGAIERGILEISKVIDSLSLWQSNAVIKEPKFDESYRIIVLNRETENFSFSFRRDPRYLREVKLDGNLQSLLRYLDPLLNKPYHTFTELEKNVANALHWYRKGNMSMDPADRFLNYIIALESLLTTEEDRESRKQKIISDRAIDVMWILKDYRGKYKDKIKKMYDYRNKIVHEGSTDISNIENEANELGTITGMALRSVAAKITECETLQEFFDCNKEEILKKRDGELEKAEKLGIEINKKIKGKGLLKRQGGELLGKVSFIFEIKDDGKFVVNEINIFYFKKVEGMVNIVPLERDFFIDGTLENIEGKIVVKEIDSYTVLEIFDVTREKRVRFHVPSFDIIKS